jgi:hypothetical protein
MPTRVHQLSDGSIIVETDAGGYRVDPATFKREYGEEFPPLPEGVTERFYQPGVVHALKRGTDVVGGGPLRWPEGDAILAQVGKLLSRQGAREHYEEVRAKLEREREYAHEEAKRKQDAEHARRKWQLEQQLQLARPQRPPPNTPLPQNVPKPEG